MEILCANQTINIFFTNPKYHTNWLDWEKNHIVIHYLYSNFMQSRATIAFLPTYANSRNFNKEIYRIR